MGFRVLQIESILCVSGRVVGGSIQRVETVVFIFHLRSICDNESDFTEAADDILGHLCQGVELAERPTTARQGEIGNLREYTAPTAA